jgi:chromosome segregation ATPase
MTFSEIENLPAAELKARFNELAAAARKLNAEELASRYVQARLDSKLRDEKLAEQGATITNLNDLMRIKVERIADCEAMLEKLEQELACLKETDAEKSVELASQTARAERLKAEATKHAEAFHAAEQALAAARSQLQINAADAGE